MAKIVAISGYMGAGKSVVGAALAADLGWAFVDLDEVVAADEGRSVADIFAQDGEEVFRELETGALRRVVDTLGDDPVVVALGGGTVTREAAVLLLRRHAFVVHLSVSAEIAWERVAESGRPLARSRADFLERAQDRRSAYATTADAVVEVDGLSAEDVVERVSEVVRIGMRGAQT